MNKMNNAILEANSKSDIPSYTEEQPVQSFFENNITGTDYIMKFEIKEIKNSETLKAISDAIEGNVFSAKDEEDLFNQLNS